MKLYLLSLGAGMLAGMLYGLIGVRSPAPPVMALVGLLGILIGKQLPGLARHWINGSERIAGTPPGPGAGG